MWYYLIYKVVIKQEFDVRFIKQEAHRPHCSPNQTFIVLFVFPSISDNEVKHCEKKKMSSEQLENAKRAVFDDLLYEDITPPDSPKHSIDYEPISKDKDWLSINSEM